MSLAGNKKVILVMVDGLRYDIGINHMRYMARLVEEGKAARFRIKTELPSDSRPMYETILTGVSPQIHGITSNRVVRLSNQKSIFHRAREKNLTTAAAAYHWVSELYNKAPFDPIEDIIQNNEDRPIQHGIFYFKDEYPDSHLFYQAEYLRKQYCPHFLLVHPMGADYTGHSFGGASEEYMEKVSEIDQLLEKLIPKWIEDGNTTVFVTGDHGMNSHGKHGNDTWEEAQVPLYKVGAGVKAVISEDKTSQLEIMPEICRIMGIS